MTKEEFTKGFWNNVKHAVKAKGVNRKTFCPEAGIKEKTFSAMICRNQCPDIWTLRNISAALDMKCSSLLYSFESDDDRVPLTGKEKKLIQLIRLIPAAKQAHVIDTVLAVLECIKTPAEPGEPAPAVPLETSSETAENVISAVAADAVSVLTQSQDSTRESHESHPRPPHSPHTRLPHQSPLPRSPEPVAAPLPPSTTGESSSAVQHTRTRREPTPEQLEKRRQRKIEAWRAQGQLSLFDYEPDAEATE